MIEELFTELGWDPKMAAWTYQHHAAFHQMTDLAVQLRARITELEDGVVRLMQYRDMYHGSLLQRTQLVAENARLREAGQERSCATCAHGYINPRYPIEEVGVSCRGPLVGNSFMPDFFCAKWAAALSGEPT